MINNDKGILPDNENYPRTIGYRIRKIRQQYGLSMSEFAKYVSPPAASSNVSNWETNLSRPNKQRLESIAKFGDVSFEYLIDGKLGKLSSLDWFGLSDAFVDSLDEHEFNSLDSAMSRALGVFVALSDRYKHWVETQNEFVINSDTANNEFEKNLDLIARINHNLFQIISRPSHDAFTRLERRISSIDDIKDNLQELIDNNPISSDSEHFEFLQISFDDPHNFQNKK